MEVPRYIVKFSDGEQELDVAEILSQFEEYKINTNTLVRPLAGGEWQEMRNLPDLLTLPFYKRIRNNFCYQFWNIGIMLLFQCLICLPLLLKGSEMVFANWQMFFLKVWQVFVFLPAFWIIPYIGGKWYQRTSQVMWCFVPYVNCFVGFFLIRKWGPQNSWMRFFNPLAWGWLFGMYIASWWLPGNTTGGIAIFIIYWIWVILLVLLTLPCSLALRKFLKEEWLPKNPPPTLTIKSSKAEKILRRRNCKYVFLYIAQCFLTIFLMVVFIFSPYYFIGKIRLSIEESKLQKEDIPVRAEFYLTPSAKPNAADEIFDIAIPEFNSKYYNLDKLSSEKRKDLENQVQELLPQLERFRAMLRKYERLGVVRDFRAYSKGKLAFEKLKNYLIWSQLVPNNPPSEILKDIEHCRKYEINENPAWGMYAEAHYTRLRNKVLEKNLLNLSNAELLAEKQLIDKSLDELQGNTKRYIYAENIVNSNNFFNDRSEIFFFIDNILATNLQIGRAEYELLKREWFANFQDYQKFVAENKKRNIYNSLSQSSREPSNRLYSTTLAAYRLWGAAIELELYRREHGVYPENPTLPRDPFSGKPLRYIKGKMLYSVNHDGIDDDGRTIQRHEVDSTDIVFELSPKL